MTDFDVGHSRARYHLRDRLPGALLAVLVVMAACGIIYQRASKREELKAQFEREEAQKRILTELREKRQIEERNELVRLYGGLKPRAKPEQPSDPRPAARPEPQNEGTLALVRERLIQDGRFPKVIAELVSAEQTSVPYVRLHGSVERKLVGALQDFAMTNNVVISFANLSYLE